MGCWLIQPFVELWGHSCHEINQPIPKHSFHSSSAWFNYFSTTYVIINHLFALPHLIPKWNNSKVAVRYCIWRIPSWYFLDLHCWKCLFSSQTSLSQLQRKWQGKKNTANIYQQLIPSTTAQLFVHGRISLFPFGAFTTENWYCTFRDTSCL